MAGTLIATCCELAAFARGRRQSQAKGGPHAWHGESICVLVVEPYKDLRQSFNPRWMSRASTRGIESVVLGGRHEILSTWHSR